MNIFFIVPPFTLERGFDVLLLHRKRKQRTNRILLCKILADSRTLRRICQSRFCRLCRGLQRLLARDIFHMVRFARIKQVHRHLLLAARTAFQHEHFGFVELPAKSRKRSC